MCSTGIGRDKGSMKTTNENKNRENSEKKNDEVSKMKETPEKWSLETGNSFFHIFWMEESLPQMTNKST